MRELQDLIYGIKKLIKRSLNIKIFENKPNIPEKRRFYSENVEEPLQTLKLMTDDSEQFTVTPTVRKRKKLDPVRFLRFFDSIDAILLLFLMELCQQLYDSIRNIKKEDGTMLCDTFIRAPKRRQEPSYYEIQKLKTDSYEDLSELSSDIELLVNNAKAFYKPESDEYDDACTLWEVFNSNKAKILESLSEDPSSVSLSAELKPRQTRGIGRPRKSTTVDDDQTSENSSENNEFDPYEELFAAVMTAVDPLDDRSLHTMFKRNITQNITQSLNIQSI
ncbi:CLUMA_CG019300, isoform A [Clunio marinus]|uniref:CLUMA_CG019300, isoform A n=1 Tax=Clunio marinus TaxID=568069 RepID=A0A1J1J1E7_9DIPT|nr:CLUMA_CG019300, isoform A [Clunio marinus]